MSSSTTPEPKKYRKKPVAIEAIKWTGGNHQAVEDFVRHNAMYWQNGDPRISTLEGTMRAEVGDYIIKGIQGEFYPCKPEIFEATYEPAE